MNNNKLKEEASAIKQSILDLMAKLPQEAQIDLENTVTISKKEYNELLKDSDKLLALESCGVDNWQGYDDAMEFLNSEEFSK